MNREKQNSRNYIRVPQLNCRYKYNIKVHLLIRIISRIDII